MRGGRREGAGRPSSQRKVEHHRRIDVRSWAQKGLLVTGRSFRCEWERDSLGAVGLSAYVDGPHAVTLFYRYQRENEDWHSEQFTIQIEHTPCHFGGMRPWFICPDCGRRSALLYASAGRWSCQKTLDLSHQCQSEDRWGQMARQIWKAEGKLGEGRSRPIRYAQENI